MAKIETVQRPGGVVEVYHNGKKTDIIKKAARGYDKFVVLNDGREFLPPCFSHFQTLRQALKACGAE